MEGTPYLEEILEFERACAELLSSTEAELHVGGSSPDGVLPPVRIVAFRHEPQALLEALRHLQTPPPGIETGEFHVLIDYRSEKLEFRLLDAEGLAALKERHS
jgi:hypothetical protein